MDLRGSQVWLSNDLCKAALDVILDRVRVTLDECGRNFPLYVDDGGRWYTTEDGNWCAGHWIGLLWIASKRSRDARTRQQFAAAARMYIDRFAPQPLGHIFAGMNHHYAGFFGLDIDGDDDLRRLGFRGANAMLRLYDPVAEQIPIGRYLVAPSIDIKSGSESERDTWDTLDLQHTAAVDVIHTSVPILWRAYAESGDSKYYDTAVAHVRRHLEWHIRADGSTTQLRPYDPDTGAPGPPLNSLAKNQYGCWSRGLAWSVAGLADAYLATGDTDVLHAIRRSMAYYTANAPSDLVPAWDLTCADSDAPRDSSAAAITAYGLMKLGGRSDPVTTELQEVGFRILASLLTDYLVMDRRAPNRGGVLHGCYRYPQGVAIDNELIWADFYAAASFDLITPF